jgi:hypothetical protein
MGIIFGKNKDDENKLHNAMVYYVFEKDTDGNNILVGNRYAENFEEYKKQIDDYGSFLDRKGKNKIPKYYRGAFDTHYSKNYRLLTEKEFNDRYFARVKKNYTERLEMAKEAYPKNFPDILKAMKEGVNMYCEKEPGCPTHQDCNYTWKTDEIRPNDKAAAEAAAEEFELKQTAGKRRRRNTKRRGKTLKRRRAMKKQ